MPNSPLVAYGSPYPGGWRNQPDTSTPIDAAALDVFEQGVKDTAAAVNGRLPLWQPNTSYVTGQAVVSPVGAVVKAISSHISASTYNGALWLADAGVRTALGVELGTVNAGAPDYGAWPTAAGSDITANLVAAITAATTGFTKSRRVLIPAGNWVADLTQVGNAWGTTNTISVHGMGCNSTYVTDTSANGGLLVNSANRVQFLDIRDLTVDNCWGVVRLAFTEASSQTGSHRVIWNVEARGVRGTAISGAANDQAFWLVDARLTAALAGTDPGVLNGTIACAIAGLMDRSEIRLNNNNFRIGGKFGNGGQNSRISFGNTMDNSASRSWYGAACWMVPEQNGPGNTDGRGPGHPGGVFFASKLGSENLVASIDYRFLSADEVGTLYATSGVGGLKITLQPMLTIPSGYTVDVVSDSGGTAFHLVAKLNGTTVETSPVFANMHAAAAWGAHSSNGGSATVLYVTDMSAGANTTAWPAYQTNTPIADWSTGMPVFTNSGGWVQGVQILSTKVTGAGSTLNPPLWSLTIPPSQLVGCSVSDNTILDSAGSGSDPNWPSYMVKFIGSTTAPTTRLLNRIRGTITNTARKVTATPSNPCIPACNVAGVFLVPSDDWLHHGIPAVAFDAAASAGTVGNGAVVPTVTGNDRRHTVLWKAASTGAVAGSTVDVTFNQPFGSAPQVTLTMGGNHAGVYVISVTATGYVIGVASFGTITSKNFVVNASVDPLP